MTEVDGPSPSPDDAVEEVFLRALELEGPAREDYLQGLDRVVRDEVESLLEHDVSTQNFFAGRLAGQSSSYRPWLQSASTETPVPAEIGSYRIVRLLGRGGMGVVYEARQESPQRVVALKVIRPGSVSPQVLRRFRYEVEVLGRLHHPGIGQIYQAGVATTAEGTQPYFAMELIEGPPLKEYVRACKLSVEEILRLFIPICDAVHYAHQKGVIHRDLKPGNILVAEHDQPKILDFGIARSTDAAPSTTHATEGHLLGTLTYMSPEQARGQTRDLDVRSDCYSLGVILFELLARELPYTVERKPVHEAVRVIQETEPRRLSTIDRSYRGDLDTILAKALEKDPARRYQSASDFARDLERFLDHEPILARPASAFYQVQKFTQRHRALVGGSTAALLFLIAGLVTSLVLLGQKHEAEVEAAVHGRRAATSVAILHVGALERLRPELFPRRPALLGEMDRWLAEARAAAAQLPRHEAFLAELRALPAAELQQLWEMPALESQFLLELEEMIETVRRWQAPDPAVGAIAEMSERRRRAAAIEAETVTAHAEEWADAIATIAELQRYDGLVLTPRVGLVPLGVDPDSELFEFWAPETGPAPEMDDEGHFRVIDDGGAVFVLLPGAHCLVGASRNTGDPNLDPLARDDEQPVHEVTLDPFFLSKYELTQAQWIALGEENRSWFQPGASTRHTTIGPGHPVERVSFDECRAVLRRVDWLLPTEAQWEYACRAGTQTPWSCGEERVDLEGFVNLADASTRNLYGSDWRFEDEIDDGFDVHAPVGSFTANDFGLHDMHGNVWEWCRDVGMNYGNAAAAPGSGVRETAGGVNALIGTCRGGSYGELAERCRSSARNYPQRSEKSRELGLRPLCPVRTSTLPE